MLLELSRLRLRLLSLTSMQETDTAMAVATETSARSCRSSIRYDSFHLVLILILVFTRREDLTDFPFQKKLQSAIHQNALLQGSKKLEQFAYSTPGRNRQMGTEGHKLTTDYIIKELKKLNGYYKVETQTFWADVMLNGTGSLELNGDPTDSGLFDYSASGEVSAPLVVVSNQGCEAVRLAPSANARILD